MKIFGQKTHVGEATAMMTMVCLTCGFLLFNLLGEVVDVLKLPKRSHWLFQYGLAKQRPENESPFVTENPTLSDFGQLSIFDIAYGVGYVANF